MNLRLRAAAPAVLALSSFAIMANGTASAAPEPLESALGGTVSLAGGTDPWPAGSSFSGTYDAETGELTGQLTFGPGSLQTQDPPSTVQYQIQATAPLEVQVTDGNATGSTELSLSLLTLDLGNNPSSLEPCVFAPIPVDLTGTVAGGKLTLNAAAVNVPATADACGGLTQIINGKVATTGSAVFEITLDASQAETPAETPADETPAETPEVSAGTAAPVVARPSYTG